VNNSGIVSFSGSLADGTKVTQSSFISGQGDWPFYASTGSKRGSLLGWLAFDSNPAAEAEVQGTVYWHKQVQPRVRYYPAGFTYVTNFSGYFYTNISPVLNFTNGNGLLVLSNGYISQTTNAPTPQPIISPVSLASNNVVKVLGANTNKIKLTVTPATGLFRGTFVNPVNRKSVSFNGAVFQKLNYASGYFRGTNQAGRVILQPQP
jgi:hypothetical protein